MKYVFDEDEVLAIKSASKANAQVIGEALEAITRRAGGSLVPEDVVTAAASPRHVLHKHFEWDDQKAAHAFRVDQARRLIRCIRVETTDTDSGTTRAWLSIRDRSGASYHSHSEVMSNADLQSRLLSAAERDLLAFEARYRDLQDVCQMIRKVRETVSARRGTEASAASL